MPRYDFKCIDSHVVEVTCSYDKIPEQIDCPKCGKKSVRFYGGMGIYSKVELGTAGGLHMTQKGSDA